MDKKQCNDFNRILSSVKIFLNGFNLILEEKKDYTEPLGLLIFDKNVKAVGTLCYNKPLIYITAKLDNDTTLHACCNKDKEYTTDSFCRMDHIVYYIKDSKFLKFNGEFDVRSVNDEKYGKLCTCHSLIHFRLTEDESITIKILNDGNTFYYYRGNDKSNESEKISVTPFDNHNNYIMHDIKKGNFDCRTHSYPYRFYAEVLNDENKLWAYLKEYVYSNVLSQTNKVEEKDTKDSSYENIIQKGLLMHSIDPKMYYRIKELGELLTIGGIPLLDNLYSISYDSYSDEELKALLGIDRKKIVYQNGSNNLYDAYFGTVSKQTDSYSKKK